MSDSHYSYVFDTSVLLHLIRGKTLGRKIDQAFGLTSGFQRQVISIATQAELWVIAARRNWETAKRTAMEHALDNLVIIPIDGKDLIEAYVTISSADFAAPHGQRNMGKNDIWIAATALYTQLPLLTTDKDFRILNGNPIQVTWIDPSDDSA